MENAIPQSTNNINKDVLLKLTRQLIGFKSITPNQAGCIDFIQTYLTNLNFKIVRLDRNDTCNLFAIWEQENTTNTNNRHNNQASKKPIIAFAGHVDVVPTGDLNHWIADPFTLTEQNGLLYGRGIADMKGAIAAFLYASSKYIEYFNNNDNQTSNFAIAFAITSDEEGSAIDGTPVIVEYLKQQNIQLDYCIVGEPSCVYDLGDVIKVGRRGSLTAHLEVIGKQGHVAYPELCINPIHCFANALAEITNTVWDNGNEYFPATALQFTNINSGLGMDNVIPNNLQAFFNLRYNTNLTTENIKKTIDNILNKHELQYNITWHHSASPFLTKRGTLVKIVTDAIKTHTGINPLLKTDGGTSDGRFLINVCSELLEFGLSNKSIHQVNECIKTNDLVQLAKTYYTTLTLFNENKIIKDD